jgi:cytochrome P450
VRFPIGANVTVEELAADPHPVLARLRRSEPVSWLPALGGWLVTRHDLAVQVMRDAAAYTVDDPRFSTARVIGPSMLSLDGPAHARHRDPFARPFRPAPMRERFTAFVTEEVDRLLAAVRPRGHAEIRSDLAGPLAVGVIARALGLDGVDAATVRSWYDAFVRAITAITAGGDGELSTESRSPSPGADGHWTIDMGSPPGRAGVRARRLRARLRRTSGWGRRSPLPWRRGPRRC